MQQMTNMHGVKLTTPEESLAVVERLLRETPRTEFNARFILHLEDRREQLIKKIESEGRGCTGLRNSGKSTGGRTEEPA